MKECFACKKLKPFNEFYAHPQMADKLCGKCKDCCKAAIMANIERRRMDPKWVSKERERCRNKIAKARAEGRYKKNSSKGAQKRWRDQNRNKVSAHLKARRYFPRTVATLCQRCGVVPKILHRHHPDYSKPLEILWLCPACHGLAHRKP